MMSERVQRRIDALLDEADEAISEQDWARAAGAARAVLAIGSENGDAGAFLAMAEANGESAGTVTRGELGQVTGSERARTGGAPTSDDGTDPESFAGGRYRVLRFLGEGGKKRVFPAHEVLLDSTTRDATWCWRTWRSGTNSTSWVSKITPSGQRAVAQMRQLWVVE